MTNLDSILKSKDITLPSKVRLVKAMVFPVVMYGCESWTVKKAEHRRIDAFELWCWRRLLRVPWTARRYNLSILKETSPGCSLEGLMLKLKLNTLATSCEELTLWKRPWCWEDLGAGSEGDDRGWDGWMASLTWWTWVWVNSGSWWWTGRPGVLWSWGCKESDTIERLNWPELKKMLFAIFMLYRNLGDLSSQIYGQFSWVVCALELKALSLLVYIFSYNLSSYFLSISSTFACSFYFIKLGVLILVHR